MRRTYPPWKGLLEVASARPGPTVTERSSRSRVIALLVVATAFGVVLSAIGGVLLLLDPSGSDGDSKDRNEVISRANDFAVANNTYDVLELADYQKRLKGLLTPAYDKQFVKITDAVFKALESKKQKSGDAKVLGAAVDSIDKDSAVAHRRRRRQDHQHRQRGRRAAALPLEGVVRQAQGGVAGLGVRERRTRAGRRPRRSRRRRRAPAPRKAEPNERSDRTRSPPPHRGRGQAGRPGQEARRPEGAGQEGRRQEGRDAEGGTTGGAAHQERRPQGGPSGQGGRAAAPKAPSGGSGLDLRWFVLRCLSRSPRSWPACS